MSHHGFAGIWKQVTENFEGYRGTRSGDLVPVSSGPPAQSTGSIEERYGISPANAARRIKDIGDRSRNRDLVTW